MMNKTNLSRRHLLGASLAAAGVAVLPNVTLGATAAAPSTSGGRERLLFDFDWKFKLGHGSDPAKDMNFGFGQADFAKTGEFGLARVGHNDGDWRTLDLPHDWAVELPFVRDEAGSGDAQIRSHGYKPLGRRFPESSIGWYRREFELPASDAGRRISIEFDGVLRDVLVFVNGSFVGRHNHGYTPFSFDLTDFLDVGAKNAIVLRVDASAGDGWFYEGAGVYRHVWLVKHDSLHIGRLESVVRSSLAGGAAKLALATVVCNAGTEPQRALVSWRVQDAQGKTVFTANSREQVIAAEGSAPFEASGTLDAPQLWSLQSPHLYTAVVSVESGGVTRDVEQVPFGIRSVVFDADKGFFLNGQSLKIQGVCNHQDHAGVGAALPDALQDFRVRVMQEMGSNAIRTSHNTPTPELVAACDRLGMMLMPEARQLSSSAEGLAQLEELVKRYRNSPSVILWSIGNEEGQLQKPMAGMGKRMATAMVRRCHRLDPTRVVTVAVNSDNEQGVSDAVDVIGFNYNQWLPDGFHKKYPKRPVLGTEVSSAISTRGEYTTDAKLNLMNSYNGVVPWGQTPEDWWKFYAEREWLAGGFAWTGFDYRGEPTPYGWPSINSQFGIVDMCGFPKDYFHYYRAWWKKAPALHVFPHWNWDGRDGQQVSVWVYSNVEEVELLVNGQSLGRKPVPRLGHLEWKVTYAPGAIEARGYSGGKQVLSERHETTGAPASIKLTPDRSVILADGEDATVVRVEVLDAKGRHVPTAGDKIAFKVSGAGRFIGVGNGDPNCLESDQEPKRSLYNGLAQLIVRAGTQPGPLVIEATREGEGDKLASARLVIEAKPTRRRPAVA
jgi:beta-galactosidase